MRDNGDSVQDENTKGWKLPPGKNTLIWKSAWLPSWSYGGKPAARSWHRNYTGVRALTHGLKNVSFTSKHSADYLICFCLRCASSVCAHVSKQLFKSCSKNACKNYRAWLFLSICTHRKQKQNGFWRCGIVNIIKYENEKTPFHTSLS